MGRDSGGGITLTWQWSGEIKGDPGKGGEGRSLRKIGWGCAARFLRPRPNEHQNRRFFRLYASYDLTKNLIPYLRPDTQFQTCLIVSFVVQTDFQDILKGFC